MSTPNNNHKYKLMINNAAYHSKEECTDHIGMIKNNNKPECRSYIRSVTADELANAIITGYTIIPAVLDENRRLADEYYKEQQIFAIDIDNEERTTKEKIADKYYLSYERIKAICRQINIEPLIIYESFRSTSEWKRYRILFAADQIITDVTLRKKLILSLIAAFNIDGVNTADTSCKDVSRVFFAGHTIVEVNPNAQIDAVAVVDAFKDKIDVVTQSEVKKAVRVQLATTPMNDNPMIAAIMNHDVATYRELLSSAIENAANTDKQRAEGTSSNSGTINFIYYLYTDYITAITQHPESLDLMRDFDTFMETTSKLPLHIMLGLPLDTNFRCIMPDHEDKHPSASINMLIDGRYVYNCWSCIGTGKYNDVVDTFACLLGTDIPGAIKFICEVFNIPTATEWQKQQRETLDFNIRYLKSDYFKVRNRLLYNELQLSKSYGALLFYLDFAREHISPEALMNDDRLVFFLSVNKASELMATQGYAGSSRTSIQRKRIYLCELGLFEKVREEDIPPDMLNKAVSVAKENHGEDAKYRQDYLFVPKYTPSLFRNAEEIIKENKSIGKKRRSLCREQILRCNGVDTADSLYSQDTDIGIDLATESFFENCLSVAAKLFTRNGYFTEKQLYKEIRGYKSEQKNKLLGICLPQLIKDNCLVRLKVNRTVRKKYNLPDCIKSNSIIITIE